MSREIYHQEFVEKLNGLPLLTDREGEHSVTVCSGWVPDVHRGDQLCGDIDVELSRFANNIEADGSPVIDYTVSLNLGPRDVGLAMPPAAAIELGRLLTAAGTAAYRDEAANTAFLVPASRRGDAA